MEALQFPRGNYYQIICKAGDFALRIQESDPTRYEKSRVIGAQPNPQDNGQVFMVEKVGLGEDQFEIVNCLSSLVFDEESKEIRLKFGKQASDQLFALVPAPVQAFHKYYWIKTDAKGEKALSLEGILRYEQFNPNKESQLFRFEQVNNPTIAQSAVIVNNFTGKALDVPKATFKKGERLIQWEKNKRWNQRWRFNRMGQGVAIQSIYNGLVLDIAEEKRTSGAKVVQWEVTGGANQLWVPEQSGNGVYRFRSVLEPSLFLGIRKQDVDNGGELEVTNEENPTIYWRLEGAQP